MEIGTVVVHKSLGSQPLVVVGVYGEVITVRYGTQGKHGVVFLDQEFALSELETPVESIEREAEIFKALNRKKDEVNEELRRSEPVSPSGIGHLN